MQDMTASSGPGSSGPQARAPAARRLACPRCGIEFGCDLSGNCWCDSEAARLPMPVAGEDCLCPACLRAAADAKTNRD
jgi:hypothetical protein